MDELPQPSLSPTEQVKTEPPQPSPSPTEQAKTEPPLDVLTLWGKYEDIAMHFNDLLMRLRSQSLAGIAAIATLVGVFAKAGGGAFKIDWPVVTAILIALTLFWLAIFCLDMLYYNRLLGGAVKAIIELEACNKSGTDKHPEINMSTIIEEEFGGWFPKWCSVKSDISRFPGVFLFYGTVMLVLGLGIWYSMHMSATSTPSPATSPPAAKLFHPPTTPNFWPPTSTPTASDD